MAAIVSMVLIGTPSDMYDGRPTIDRNNPAGYYVWRGGGQWHVRWVAVDHARAFKGSVTAEGGGIGSMKEIDPADESRNYLAWVRHLTVTVGRANSVGSRAAPPPQNDERTSIQKKGVAQIVFDARINDKIGGFDFAADDSVMVLRFDLKVDGKPRPDMLKIGGESQPGTELPLFAKLR